MDRMVGYWRTRLEALTADRSREPVLCAVPSVGQDLVNQSSPPKATGLRSELERFDKQQLLRLVFTRISKISDSLKELRGSEMSQELTRKMQISSRGRGPCKRKYESYRLSTSLEYI